MLSAVAARRVALSTNKQSRSFAGHDRGEAVSVSMESEISTNFGKRKVAVAVPVECNQTRADSRKRHRASAVASGSLSNTRYRYQDDLSRPTGTRRYPSEIGGKHGDDVEPNVDLQYAGDGRRRSPVSRAWSPSQPAIDSSEDEDSAPIESRNEEYLFAKDSPQDSSGGALSSFIGNGALESNMLKPILGLNAFTLDREMLSRMHVSFPWRGEGNKATLVYIREGESLALIGSYQITVIRGSIFVLGTKLPANPLSSHQIFAPKCSAVPVLQASNTFSQSSSNLDDIPEHIRAKIPADSALVLLRDSFTGIEGIADVWSPLKGAFEHVDCDLQLTTAHSVNAYSATLRPFLFPTPWQSAVFALQKNHSQVSDEEDCDNSVDGTHPIIIVKGPRRTGKSSFARVILNNLLSRYGRVAFLDCDPGQAEFTPPGLVSLHILDQPVFGPPFTHPRLPYKAHYVGCSTPRNGPSHYLSSIEALVETYRLDIQYSDSYGSESDRDNTFVPLVVNTTGWSKGMGAELTKRIEEMVEPSHVFSFVESYVDGEHMIDMPGLTRMPQTRSDELTSSMRQIPEVVDVVAIPSSIQSSRYSATDWRNVSILSYFYSEFPTNQRELLPATIRTSLTPSLNSNAQNHTWNTTLALTARAPYCMSPSVALDNVVLIGPDADDVVHSEVGRVLNGAIVALVASEVESSGIDVARGVAIPYEQGSPPPDPRASSCVGLALIRGVSPDLLEAGADGNPSLGVMQILTPIPRSLLGAAKCRCLVKGEIEMPVWGMLDLRESDRTGSDGDRDVHGEDVPYLQWSRSEVVGAERRRARRNIMRRAQM